MSPLTFASVTKKSDAVTIIRDYCKAQNLHIVEEALDKPWGAYFRMEESDIRAFAKLFFADQTLSYEGLLTPKFLLVEPESALSWQYHYRRAEVWRVVVGPVKAVQSKTDAQTAPKTYQTGELISHGVLVRHRLMGASGWGLVAEIWQHTDPVQPSDESDIVRLEDRYSRT